jgi:hypothetical protein
MTEFEKMLAMWQDDGGPSFEETSEEPKGFSPKIVYRNSHAVETSHTRPQRNSEEDQTNARAYLSLHNSGLVAYNVLDGGKQRFSMQAFLRSA